MNKHLTLFAALAAATCLTGNAADYTLGGLGYNVISDVTKTVSVVESSSATGDVVIPATVTLGGVQYSVTEIGKQAFADAKITSVSIPELVIKIGDGAFMSCSKLKSVTFNATECSLAGTQTISAFSGCTAVTSVKLGDNVTIIPAYIFQGLTSLRSISIPRKVSTIGDRAFADCTSVTEIYFDAEHCGTVSNPFAGCSSPFNLIISDNVEEIPKYLCRDSRLRTLTIGRNVKTIKGGAFYSNDMALESVNYNAIDAICETDNYGPPFSFYWADKYSSLKKLVLGSGVKKIPPYLAHKCSSLSTVVWNEELEEIGENAFSSCSFVSFTAPKSLKRIGDYGLPETLTTVELNEGLEYLSGLTRSKIVELKIPSSVKELGNYAFNNCTKLVKVEGLDSDNIESIDTYAFAGSPIKLGKFKFGKNLKTIGDNAFNGITTIDGIELNDNLESVGNFAFTNSTVFKNGLVLPNLLKSVGKEAFRNSGISGKLVIPENLAGYASGAFANNANITEIEYNGIDLIIDRYSEYDLGVFQGIPLKTIKFGNKVKYIGANMFKGMTELEEVIFPESLIAIWDDAFRGCTKLQSIKLNEGLKEMVRSFRDCTSLTSVSIPSTVTYFNVPFESCTHLVDIDFNAKESSTWYSKQVFDYMTHLTIGEPVEVVDFVLFSAPTLTWIKWDAVNMKKLSTKNTSNCPVILSDKVISFFGNSFKTVISNAVVPPALTNPVTGATAYVPDVEAYEEDANWAKYILRQSVTWSGKIDGQKLTYTTNFPYELTLKHYLDSDGNVMAGTPCELGDYKAIFTYTIDEDEFELISPLSIKANTSNTMRAADVRAHTGRKVVIPVEMVNDQPITSFQFDLYLPEGMKLAADEYGDYMVDLTARKSNTHSVSTADIDGGKGVRVAAMSMRNQSFSGNDGVLVELTVDVAADAPVGDAILSLRNIRMVEPSSAAQEFFTNRNDAKVSIGGFVEGDTNDDGQVTVADVVNTVNMVLGIEPDTFVFAAADLVADGKITISDVVAVMNIAMNAGSKVAAVRGAASEEPVAQADAESSADGYGLSVGEVKLIAGETGEMSVAMDNVENVTAFQFDLYLPEGITVPEDEWGDPSILLSKRAARTHMLVTRYQPDGALRVASYSSKNDPFRANSGELLTIDLKAAEDLAPGEYNIGFNFIELTNPDATPHYVPDFNVVASVGLSGQIDLCLEPAEFRVSGGSGEIIVSAPEATDLKVCNIAGVVVASREVGAGVTRIPAAPGFYLVNGIKLLVR